MEAFRSLIKPPLLPHQLNLPSATQAQPHPAQSSHSPQTPAKAPARPLPQKQQNRHLASLSLLQYSQIPRNHGQAQKTVQKRQRHFADFVEKFAVARSGPGKQENGLWVDLVAEYLGYLDGWEGGRREEGDDAHSTVEETAVYVSTDEFEHKYCEENAERRRDAFNIDV